MITIEWPELFGSTLIEASMRTEAASIVTTSAYGKPNRIKISNTDYNESEISIRLNDIQFACFRSWHVYKLFNGCSDFFLDVPELGYRVPVSMILGSYQVSTVSLNLFEVTFGIRYNPKLDDEVFALSQETMPFYIEAEGDYVAMIVWPDAVSESSTIQATCDGVYYSMTVEESESESSTIQATCDGVYYSVTVITSDSESKSVNATVEGAYTQTAIIAATDDDTITLLTSVNGTYETT